MAEEGANEAPIKMKKSVEILETTLRDGAYMIDFQFTAEHVAHPVGMNAHQYDIVHVSLPGAK